ncbi:MAG: hypothetical protein M1818_004169 [Claussenomyces sp. TS43310]|nr:MAG: hypothetical protein M1818_004169 [Claussenomyces sp. TS43310]
MSPTEENLTFLIGQPTVSQQSFHHPNAVSMIQDAESAHNVMPAQTCAGQSEHPLGTSPFSPFYSHQTSCSSLHEAKSESKPSFKVYENDLEAGLTKSQSSLITLKPDPNCPVWPGIKAQKQKSKAERRSKARGCNILNRYDRKTRLCIQTLIALAVIGCIIGIGLGVNKTVGGGVWHDKNPQQ